ncbi:hypothetical protein GLA29479_4816 [Lysobacter antibioticus]|nr:hypothetical protein GLA29479_4816 [Lysobacter antibioticus]
MQAHGDTAWVRFILTADEACGARRGDRAGDAGPAMRPLRFAVRRAGAGAHGPAGGRGPAKIARIRARRRGPMRNPGGSGPVKRRRHRRESSQGQGLKAGFRP